MSSVNENNPISNNLETQSKDFLINFDDEIIWDSKNENDDEDVLVISRVSTLSAISDTPNEMKTGNYMVDTAMTVCFHMLDLGNGQKRRENGPCVTIDWSRCDACLTQDIILCGNLFTKRIQDGCQTVDTQNTCRKSIDKCDSADCMPTLNVKTCARAGITKTLNDKCVITGNLAKTKARGTLNTFQPGCQTFVDVYSDNCFYTQILCQNDGGLNLDMWEEPH